MKPKMVLRKSSYHVNSLIKQVDDSNFVPFSYFLLTLTCALRDCREVASKQDVISSWSLAPCLSQLAVDHVLLERWQYTSAFLQPPPASREHTREMPADRATLNTCAAILRNTRDEFI